VRQIVEGAAYLVEPWQQLVQTALAQYDISDPQTSLIRHNENLTCQVISGKTDEQFVLRIHRPVKGFSSATAQHSLSALQSELMFIGAIHENTDIPVQKPVQNRDNRLVSEIDDPEGGGKVRVTVLTWIDGRAMHQEDPEWAVEAYQAGVMTAKLHDFASRWEIGRSLDRHSYDVAKVRSVAESIGDAVSLGLITPDHYKVIREGGDRICELMAELDDRGSQARGLIHADLQKTNLIVQESGVAPIDFCLCGHGYYYMDLGGISADFSPLHIRKALLSGYRSVRELPDEDMKYIEAFFVMTILLFMATHLHNPKVRMWFSRRVPPICEDYILPMIGNGRFYESI